RTSYRLWRGRARFGRRATLHPAIVADGFALLLPALGLRAGETLAHFRRPVVGAAAVRRVVLPVVALHGHVAVDHRGVVHDHSRRLVVVRRRAHHAHAAPAPVE